MSNYCDWSAVSPESTALIANSWQTRWRVRFSWPVVPATMLERSLVNLERLPGLLRSGASALDDPSGARRKTPALRGTSKKDSQELIDLNLYTRSLRIRRSCPPLGSLTRGAGGHSRVAQRAC